jgi:hypothetical protein
MSQRKWGYSTNTAVEFIHSIHVRYNPWSVLKRNERVRAILLKIPNGAGGAWHFQ